MFKTKYLFKHLATLGTSDGGVGARVTVGGGVVGASRWRRVDLKSTRWRRCRGRRGYRRRRRRRRQRPTTVSKLLSADRSTRPSPLLRRPSKRSHAREKN